MLGHGWRALVVAAGVLAAATCSNSAPEPSSTADGVRVHGIVTDLTLASCDDVSAGTASGLRVTFEDGEGNVVGTTTTGVTTLTPSSGYCAATAPYSVTISRASVYEASAPGMKAPERMSFADLERAGFTWDLGPEIQVDEGS
jgi:hypothetical protein